MTWWRHRWVVMVPGEVAWVERRTREILDEEEFEDHYTVVPGQGRYQAIVQADDRAVGPEMVLGEALSLECEEPVYCVDRNGEEACVWRWVRGKDEWDSRQPAEVARELECVMPWDNEPPRPHQRAARKVVLIQGLSKARVLNALDRLFEVPAPAGYYCLEEVPQGLILRDGTGELVFENLELARRFPRATVYTAVFTPDMDFFSVTVRHNRKTSEFVLPPREFPRHPVLDEVMGERTPERILAALGMSKEWFQL